jgi:predicted glycoside hydrolase/deacetylase ChbG (UPF0249 family)
VKWLIVNGDDFGMSDGINRGILEAHRCGILTSASVFVNGCASENAARAGREWPTLSLGLHLELDPDNPARVLVELERQYSKRVLETALNAALSAGTAAPSEDSPRPISADSMSTARLGANS